MVDLVLNNFTTDRGYGEEFFKKILERAAEEAGLGGKGAELSINIVGEGRIKQLNKKYRGRNRVTDVLSFPLNPGSTEQSRKIGIPNKEFSFNDPGNPRTRAKHGAGHATEQSQKTQNFERDILALGDIFICLPVAKKHAQRESMSLDSKMAFLTIHGFLHLLGHGHEKPEERDAMFEIQDRVLASLNFSS